MQRQGQAPAMAPSLSSKSSDALGLSSQGLPKTGKNQLAPKNVSGKLTYEQQLSGYSAQANANSMQAGSYGQGRPLEACVVYTMQVLGSSPILDPVLSYTNSPVFYSYPRAERVKWLGILAGGQQLLGHGRRPAAVPAWRARQ